MTDYIQRMQQLNNSIDEFRDTIKNCSKIDIGERRGATGYIDFISKDEVSEVATSGEDYFGREFVVLKGKIHYNDDTTKDFFQTFFRRYSDSYTSYMGAGSWSEDLMCTTGAMNANQIRFVSNLIKLRDINIDQYVSEFATGNIENFVNEMRFTIPFSETDTKTVKRIYLC